MDPPQTSPHTQGSLPPRRSAPDGRRRSSSPGGCAIRIETESGAHQAGWKRGGGHRGGEGNKGICGGTEEDVAPTGGALDGLGNGGGDGLEGGGV